MPLEWCLAAALGSVPSMVSAWSMTMLAGHGDRGGEPGLQQRIEAWKILGCEDEEANTEAFGKLPLEGQLGGIVLGFEHPCCLHHRPVGQPPVRPLPSPGIELGMNWPGRLQFVGDAARRQKVIDGAFEQGAAPMAVGGSTLGASGGLDG